MSIAIKVFWSVFWFVAAIAISGLAAGGRPSLGVSPMTYDFGAVPVGTSADHTLSVTNTGTGTLTGSVTAFAPYRQVLVPYSPPKTYGVTLIWKMP